MVLLFCKNMHSNRLGEHTDRPGQQQDVQVPVCMSAYATAHLLTLPSTTDTVNYNVQQAEADKEEQYQEGCLSLLGNVSSHYSCTPSSTAQRLSHADGMKIHTSYNTFQLQCAHMLAVTPVPTVNLH
jgi:hypothetical protein